MKTVEVNVLLDAVDALTKPVINHVAQKTDAGAWLRVKTIEHVPLLQQMHDSVHPSSNAKDGSGSSKSTRSVIDLDALFEYAKMSSAIRSWCNILKVQPTRDPVVDLRRWYVAFTALPEHDDTFYRRELRRWAGIIHKHLDPPQSFVPEGACPICGQTSWGDRINGGDMWPIVVEYRIDDNTGNTKDHTALCRLCRTLWEGYDSVMELAEEINEKRA